MLPPLHKRAVKQSKAGSSSWVCVTHFGQSSCEGSCHVTSRWGAPLPASCHQYEDRAAERSEEAPGPVRGMFGSVWKLFIACHQVLLGSSVRQVSLSAEFFHSYSRRCNSAAGLVLTSFPSSRFLPRSQRLSKSNSGFFDKDITGGEKKGAGGGERKSPYGNTLASFSPSTVPSHLKRNFLIVLPSTVINLA